MEKRVVKVKDEFKARLEKARESVNKSLYDLGYTEFNITQLNNEKDLLARQKNTIEEELKLVLAEQEAILKEVEEEYGSGELNLETYDITLDA